MPIPLIISAKCGAISFLSITTDGLSPRNPSKSAKLSAIATTSQARTPFSTSAITFGSTNPRPVTIIFNNERPTATGNNSKYLFHL
jgi:hypothetical protein